MRNKMMVIALLPLIGCATATQIYTPSGKLGYNIECNGYELGWAQCYEKAGETCGSKGYEILDKVEESNEVVSGQANSNSAVVSSTPIVTRNMVIQCND